MSTFQTGQSVGFGGAGRGLPVPELIPEGDIAQ
jgi:hypothetical protein